MSPPCLATRIDGPRIVPDAIRDLATPALQRQSSARARLHRSLHVIPAIMKSATAGSGQNTALADTTAISSITSFWLSSGFSRHRSMGLAQGHIKHAGLPIIRQKPRITLCFLPGLGLIRANSDQTQKRNHLSFIGPCLKRFGMFARIARLS